MLVILFLPAEDRPLHPTWDGLNAVFLEVVEVLPHSICACQFV